MLLTSPTFADLAELEPRLGQLAADAASMRPDRDGSFCGADAWIYVIKPTMSRLVGWSRQTPGILAIIGAPDDILRSHQAWELASRHMISCLPPCVNCSCINI